MFKSDKIIIIAVFVKRFKKKFDGEKIYNYLNLDKKLNRNLFIFGVFFGYWFLFYVVSIVISSFIYKENINASIILSSVPELIIAFFSSKTLISTINNIFAWYGQYLLAPSFIYFFIIAPILIILPVRIIYRILPKINKLIIILLGGVVVIFSIMHIYFYIYNSLIIAPMSPQIW